MLITQSQRRTIAHALLQLALVHQPALLCIVSHINDTVYTSTICVTCTLSCTNDAVACMMIVTCTFVLACTSRPTYAIILMHTTTGTVDGSGWAAWQGGGGGLSPIYSGQVRARARCLGCLPAAASSCCSSLSLLLLSAAPVCLLCICCAAAPAH